MNNIKREKAIAIGIIHLFFYEPDECNPDMMTDDELFDMMAISRFAWNGGDWYAMD